jgi:predicted ATPase
MWFRRRNRGKIKESQQAILDATKTLREVRARDPEVREISRTLKEIRERNHFAENLRAIMQRG